jgi:hypothetical protein
LKRIVILLLALITSMIKNIKIQLNYLLRDENMVAGFDTLKNNLFYINWQFTY